MTTTTARERVAQRVERQEVLKLEAQVKKANLFKKSASEALTTLADFATISSAFVVLYMLYVLFA